jgi:hypothetical protein
MDEREIRLQQLARKLVLDEITEGEEQEYDKLQQEQNDRLNEAIATLARRRVKLRLPRLR